MLINTKREKEIFLGTTYPFEKLASGSCLLNSYQRSALGLNVGSLLSIETGLSMIPTLNAVIENYN